MLADPSSFLNVDPLFTLNVDLLSPGETFGLRELIAGALSASV